MKNTQKIVIIGTGWLGLPLKNRLGLKYLAVTGYNSKNLTVGITNLKAGDYSDILESDVLIYTVPPIELSSIKHFFDQLPENKKILFTSSTSYYGKNLGLVSEESIIDLEKTSSPLLYETELYLRNRFSNLTIIRPGGLYGNKRHPSYFLQGKKLTNGDEYLHLVHLEDCLNAYEKIIEHDIFNEIFNLVCDAKYLKSDYYTFMAEKLKLTPPVFEKNINPKIQTKICNKKSKEILSINFLDPINYT